MTELGPIPVDWEVKRLGDVCSDYAYGTGAEAIYYDGENKYIRITDIDEESHLFSPAPLTSPSIFAEKHVVKDNDLLIARTGASVGKSYFYSRRDGKLIFAGFLMKANVKSAEGKYVFYVTLTDSYKKWVLAESARSGQPGINIRQLQDLLIPLPPLAEQRRIAGALSDVDELISALGKLIEKKHNIKTGTMQQLLTGKTRLPGFKGKWVEKPFCEFISRFATGLNPRQNFKLNSGGSNYYITIKDFKDGRLSFKDCDMVDDVALRLINERSDLRAGDLLFSSIGRVGDAYVIKDTPSNWNINESVFSLRPDAKQMNVDFLFYLVKSSAVQERLTSGITGSTLTGIKIGELRSIVCFYPNELAEQKAIAAVLSDMDAEIAALEADRAKYESIKQGMMQELLTGKTRLKP